MIKLGEKRINPGHIKSFLPVQDNRIQFDFDFGEPEIIYFENEKERDDMLKRLDNYLVRFDNGTFLGPELSDIPSFLFGGQGGGSEPGGFTMQ